MHSVLDDLHRDVIDVRAEVSFRRRSYNGSHSGATRTFRVVGIWNDDAEKHHLYVINLPAADYGASDIAHLYRTRLEVELLFKELKPTYNLDQVSTSNPVAVEALILVALISLVVSRVLLDLLRELANREAASNAYDEPCRTSPAAVVAGVQLLQWADSPAGHTVPRLRSIRREPAGIAARGSH